jgi:hypothetical protein
MMFGMFLVQESMQEHGLLCYGTQNAEFKKGWRYNLSELMQRKARLFT